jgi:hypothetical protein
MQSNSYGELIEEKIKEWQNKLLHIEETVKKEAVKGNNETFKMFEQLNKAVDSAKLKLRELDREENASNTLMIKENILEIFDSIDKVLIEQQDKTPFML